MSASQRVGRSQVYANPREIYKRMAVSFNGSSDQEVPGKRQISFLRAKIVQGVSLHHLLYPRIHSPEQRHRHKQHRDSPDLRIEALRLCPQTGKERRKTQMNAENRQIKRIRGLINAKLPTAMLPRTRLASTEKAVRVHVRRKSMDVREAAKDAEWTAAAKEAMNREFSRLLNLSNGLVLSIPPQSEEHYRYYVGPGNNGALVDRVMRTRRGWIRVKSIQDSDFVWSQKKEPEILQFLPTASVWTAGNIQYFPSSGFKCPVKYKEPGSGMLRSVNVSAVGYEKVLGSASFRLLSPATPYTSLRTHNKLECNYNLANKKALFLNMKQYYEAKGVDYLTQMPLTFHIINGENDPEFLKFEAAFREGERKKEQSKWSSAAFFNLWIVKPGENSNQGRDITVASMIEHVKSEIRKNVCPITGKRRSYIVQKYIETPFLYKNRKFDLRCYSLITSINGVIQGYYYPEGYIRTSCREFDLESVWDRFIHLTNDAVQKHSEDYGRFEMGNKLSYLDFQKYLELRFPAISQQFQTQVLPSIRQLVKDTMEATFLKLDPKRRNASFEVFGYDFMLDSDLKPWLIEVNTNPCLELSSAVLGRVIPSMLEGAFKIVLDSWFPETGGGQKKKAETLYENRWELLFSETVDGRVLLEELGRRGTVDLVGREDPALADMSDEEETHSDPESEDSGN